MKKTLVTGAGGFIGSHLVELLVAQGCDVKAFVHYNSTGSWEWLDQSYVKKDIEVIAGDIRDYDFVENAVKDCSTVFHLAALIGIPYSYVSPQAYIRTNIEGTFNILQAARNHGIDEVLVTSTSETYGTAQYVPIDEKHPAVGQSPYAATKVAADQLALSFHKSFDLPVKVVRPFNTFGPRQSARAIIPTVMSQIADSKSIIEIGDLHPTRDVTFVEDTVRGFWAIHQTKECVGTATNICMQEEISMGDLINLIGKVTETNLDLKQDPKRMRPSKSEVQRLFGSNEKIKTFSNWKAQENLESGLKKTWAWFQSNRDRYRSGQY
ncbi:MAG: SDR family NAD(P)-dependent oxidoreductase, partial [bacterium]